MNRAVLPGKSEPLVMGILNVTPDSFSDGGKYQATHAAIARGLELTAQGAHLIDVGGESTRPGAEPVTRDEEIRRIVPVIEALASEGVAVSVDTIHSTTAAAAVEAGAILINDVSGGLFDADIYRVAAETGVQYAIGHWRGIPDPGHTRSVYGDVVDEVRTELSRVAYAAISAGVQSDRLLIDPGLGFDKSADQGWALLKGLDRLISLGFPVLVGISRKRMLGELLASLPGENQATAPETRDLATSVVSALAASAGASAVRVHDVLGTVQALAVQHAWQVPGPPNYASKQSLPDLTGQLESVSHQQHQVSFAQAGRHESLPSTETRCIGNSMGDDQGVAAGQSVAAEPCSPAENRGANGLDPHSSGDRITLTGLEVFAHHGVFDFEREHGQRFLIDAELAVQLGTAAGTDDLANTVHYGELAEAIVTAVSKDPVDLIETVAERVAQVALGFSGVHWARITVHKPDAPIQAPFVDVSVTVVRSAVGGVA